MKQCKECGKEFQPVPVRGTEQMYCSKTCQSRAARKRHEQRMIDKMKNNETQETQRPGLVGAVPNVQRSTEFSSNLNDVQREDVPAAGGGRSFANIDSSYLERYYEEKISNNFYKLKNEALEKRVLELEREVFDLNSELDKIEEDSNNDDNMLGSIMTQFKKDPVNTANFVSSLFDNLKKPNQ